ncbi:MAG: DUF2071 domain-containing protein [Verrucomicrobia bacterium]|nr:DUF2071 domain-containing protein [Verrucomicrobiota bacterium]
MYQSWQKLLFLHWEVDAAEIQTMLPEGLYVDTFKNSAYVGIVPFYMWNIRPRYLPALPWVSYFLELNVRTYVHDENGVPGVWFFSLDTNQPIAAYLGRRFFYMPYTNAHMQAEKKNEGVIQYQCHRKNTSNEKKTEFVYRGISDSETAKAGTLDYFLVERYLLYALSPKSDALFSGRVFHKPYPLQKAEVSRFSREPIRQAGICGVEGDPVHAIYSEGVDVLAYAIEKQ